MTSAGATTVMEEKTFAGHPRGLVNLFCTEMWERFSYYGMRAILVLYMVAAVSEGGLGMSNKEAGGIYGFYTMCVYLSALPGGFIGDRFLGARKAVLIGGIIIALGHFTIAVPSIHTLYAGMAMIVLGTGLLKPNMSTMVGMLYKTGDTRRDAGFSIFYMGVNIGAMLAPLVCGFLAQGAEFKAWLTTIGMPPHVSWHWGFGAAGVGMVFGLLFYVLQGKMLGDAGLRPSGKKEIAASEAAATSAASDASNDAPKLESGLTKEEISRIGAIAVLFVFNILFWAIYEQGGSSLNLFATNCTDCSIFGWKFPSSWLQTFQASFVIIFAPVFSWLWIKLGEKQPVAPAKFAIGILLLGLGITLMVPASMLAAQGLVSPWWLVCVYLLEVLGELCLSPVGLSTVTKLAPARYVALTMGAWYTSISMGNFVAGQLSGFFDEKNVSGMTTLFGSMGGAAIVAAILMACMVPLVKKLMGTVR
jgi:POT family proton-dependent oligopeptide transporter